MTDPTCATCGQPITITTRNPNRRYCSARCRVADWHARNRRAPTHTGDAGNDVPHPASGVPHDVPPANAVPTPANAVPIASGVQHCPHCHRELAVIAVVIPPAAAHVRTPKVIPMNPG